MHDQGNIVAKLYNFRSKELFHKLLIFHELATAIEFDCQNACKLALQFVSYLCIFQRIEGKSFADNYLIFLYIAMGSTMVIAFGREIA